MEDDNKYACNACGTRQDAVRSIELDRLPPVLNVQLLRFVFDRKLGRKKKLLTFIEFGETLDMSKYLNQKPGTSSTAPPRFRGIACLLTCCFSQEQQSTTSLPSSFIAVRVLSVVTTSLTSKPCLPRSGSDSTTSSSRNSQTRNNWVLKTRTRVGQSHHLFSTF